MTTKTTTRYLGTCPCCEGTVKIRKGVMVHHGYKRPGCGYIVGDCWGVGRTPHEVSPETAQGYLEVLVGIKARLERSLEVTPETLQERIGAWGPETTLTPESPKWEQALRGHRAQLASQIRAISQDVARVQGLIATWEPRPIMTVEESKTLAKAQQEAAKAAKEGEKARLVASAPQDARDELRAALEAQDPQAVSRAWQNAQYTFAPRAKTTLIRFLKGSGLEAPFRELGFGAGKADRPGTRATESLIIRLQVSPTPEDVAEFQARMDQALKTL
jgi:hypothetical protein